ncbi:MAG: hypothetical protein NTX52_05305, partial [Planctomycetota bacterium]|nr:hypothetical protein [Planctomycetota bacterium]
DLLGGSKKGLIVVGSVAAKNGIVLNHSEGMADPSAEAFVYVIQKIAEQDGPTRHILVGCDGYRELKYGRYVGDEITFPTFQGIVRGENPPNEYKCLEEEMICKAVTKYLSGV